MRSSVAEPTVPALGVTGEFGTSSGAHGFSVRRERARFRTVVGSKIRPVLSYFVLRIGYSRSLLFGRHGAFFPVFFS